MNYRLEGEINSRCWGQDWRLPRCIRLQASLSGTGNGRGSEFDLTGVQKFRSKITTVWIAMNIAQLLCEACVNPRWGAGDYLTANICNLYAC